MGAGVSEQMRFDRLCCVIAVGAQARLMSHALRKITANASKCHTTIIFLNQLRMKVKRTPPCPHVKHGLLPAHFGISLVNLSTTGNALTHLPVGSAPHLQWIHKHDSIA